MKKYSFHFKSIAIVTSLGLATLYACTGSRPRQASRGGQILHPPPGLEKIEHFVFIVQENRSFDHYFGTYPGADGIPKGTSVPDPRGGPPLHSYHDTNEINRGGPHDWDNAWADINDGKMDGFLGEAYKGKIIDIQLPKHDLPANLVPSVGNNARDVMGYHDYHEIPNYWNYARLFVLQDHFFESVASYSLPAHLYMLAAQSGGFVTPRFTLKATLSGRFSGGTPKTFTFPEITEFLTSGKID